MKPHQVIIAVGSNIEPDANVSAARELLSEEQEFLGESSFEQTKPVGYQEQPDFLNGAFWIATDLEAGPLKTYLLGIEDRLGRVRGPIKSGPRTIDLDIIVYDGRVVHDDFETAAYVRRPVLELIERFGLVVSR